MHYNIIQYKAIKCITIHYEAMKSIALHYNTIQYNAYIHPPDYTLCWRARAATSSRRHLSQFELDWTNSSDRGGASALSRKRSVSDTSACTLDNGAAAQIRPTSTSAAPSRIATARLRCGFIPPNSKEFSKLKGILQTRRSSPNPKEFSKLEGELTRCTCAKLGLSAFTSSSAPSRLAPTRDSPETPRVS